MNLTRRLYFSYGAKPYFAEVSEKVERLGGAVVLLTSVIIKSKSGPRQGSLFLCCLEGEEGKEDNK